MVPWNLFWAWQFQDWDYVTIALCAVLISVLWYLWRRAEWNARVSSQLSRRMVGWYFDARRDLVKTERELDEARNHREGLR